MKEKKAERRRFIRFDLDTNVKYRFFDDIAVDTTMKGKAKNLSADGVCIITREKIPWNKDIELDISLPGRKRPIRVHGRVVWTHSIKGSEAVGGGHFEAGISLNPLFKEDENVLLKYYCERMVDNLSQYLRL